MTDRVRQVYRQRDISVILVIGGSSEYLKIADTVILMDEYVPADVSGEINETIRKTTASDEIIITNREKGSFIKEKLYYQQMSAIRFYRHRRVFYDFYRQIDFLAFGNDIYDPKRIGRIAPPEER
ncbi:MAG: hypothetical protein K6G90_09270 [Clostridia bacterium]|nr:hypothetical protein [Clostridia bacterium]